jgi:hypothetical protein
LEKPRQPVALLAYGCPPEASRVLTGGVKLPFEQVGDQDLKATFKLTVFTSAQRLKLLHKMFLVQLFPHPKLDH